MNTKTILGASFALVFAVSMIGTATATGEGFLKVVDGGVDNNNPNIAKITIVAEEPIPRDAGNTLGGYAWFTSGDTEWPAFAITTHNAGDGITDDANVVNDVRDSTQNPDGWHLHLVKVDGNACITDVTDSTQGGIKVDKNGVMRVTVPTNELDGGSISGQASGFNIVPGQAICDGKHPLQLQVQFVTP